MPDGYTHLTIIIRDPAPVPLLNEPVGLRRVTFALTPEQRAAIVLKHTGTCMGTKIHEDISACFLEALEGDDG